MTKIPVRQTIAAAYRFAFVGLEKVIALIWFPMILITIGDYFSSGAILAGRAEAIDSGDFTRLGPVVAGQFVFGIVELILTCVVGVAICREILKPMEGRPSFLRFTFGSSEMRAAGGIAGTYMVLLLAAVICGTVGMILSGALGRIIPGGNSSQQAIGFAVLVGIVLLPFLLPLFVRLSYFIFPAVLNPEGKFGMEQSWKLAKGNVWRIIAISLAVAVPPLLVSAFANAIVLGPDSLNPHWEMLTDKAAMDRFSMEQSRQIAANLPVLKGLEFVLAPFLYGLIFSAPAFAYKFLTEPESK